MNRIINALLLLFLTFTLACGQEAASGGPGDTPRREAPAPKADFPAGEVIEAVKVDADTGLSYALYLPKNYTHDRSWPLMLFFDSHGRGKRPVRRYSVLADLFEMPVAASNDSRNGLAPEQYLNIADRTLADLRKKLNVDGRRVYAAGFSGGARVAALLAQNRVDIAGVIGCGAGFQPRQNDSFNFMGIVGMEDFNYQEMRRLDEALDQTGVRHLFTYWVGGHEWPPFSIMAKGFQWHRMRAVEDGFVAKSDTALATMLMKFRRQDEQLKTTGTAWHRWLLRKDLIAYIDGLTDVSEFRTEMAALAEAPAVAAERKRREQELQREMLLRQKYAAAIAKEPVDYWKRVAKMLRKAGRHGVKEEAWLNMRILNFLSLNVYLQAEQALRSGQLAAADRLIRIYALVDPENAEHRYMAAQLAMKRGRQPAALQALEAAAELGLEDPGRLRTEPLFGPLRDMPRFRAVLEQIREE